VGGLGGCGGGVGGGVGYGGWGGGSRSPSEGLDESKCIKQNLYRTACLVKKERLKEWVFLENVERDDHKKPHNSFLKKRCITRLRIVSRPTEIR